jgi:hypothetical protein
MHEVERPPNSECLRDDSCAGPVADRYALPSSATCATAPVEALEARAAH